MRPLTVLRLGRVSNLPTVWTNVLAAWTVAGPAQRTSFGPLIPFGLTLLACSLFYVAGMFLNDYFDRASDAVSRPDRPIPAGEVDATAVAAGGFATLALALATLVGAGAWLGHAGAAALAGLALAAAIVGYDLHHKENPVGPLLMGFCRFLVYVCVAAVVASRPNVVVLVAGGLLVVYVVGLTQVAKRRLVSEGGVAVLIAGISIFDAVVIATAGHGALALVAAGGFAATLALQRFVPGT